MTARLQRAALLVSLACAACCPPAASALPTSLPIDPASAGNVVIEDQPPWEVQTYETLGDVNGNGLADVALGIGTKYRTRTFVLLGRRGNASFRVPLPPSAGFEITSRRYDLGLFAGAGDVNADGLADLVVAAFEKRDRRNRRGGAYVVFGRRDHGPVDLDRLGRGGFRIAGRERGSFAGYAVGGAGDVNGDGRSDVILSAPGFQLAFRTAYVVFGKGTSNTIHLGKLRRNGFEIRGPRRSVVGGAVTGIGDMNGDGLSDVALDMSPEALTSFDHYSEYVVFGKRSTSPVSLRRIGGHGIHLATSRWLDSFDTLDAAGDVNGDGLADLLIGVPDVSLHDDTYGFVVFGSRTLRSFRLDSLGNRGLRVSGPGADAESALGAVGDLNADGRSDIAALPPSDGDGPVFVVFGRTQSGAADMRSLGNGGVQLATGVRSPVTGIGDFNGDRRADVMLSQNRSPAPDRTLIIFG